MAHTPGPWEADSMGVVTGGPNRLTSICQTPQTAWCNAIIDALSRAHPTEDGRDAGAWLSRMVDESIDNARLIAAAPALLVACKDALEVCRQLDEEGVACDSPLATWRHRLREMLQLSQHAIALAAEREIAHGSTLSLTRPSISTASSPTSCSCWGWG